MTDVPETPPPAEPPATPPPPPPPPPASGAAGYPLTADIVRQEEYNRWLPFVKWLLLIPHYIALAILGIVAFIVIVIAFFAVIFTRRYPRGMYDFVVGVSRWGWRVMAYLFLMTDRYPPFSLDHDPDYPATFNIVYPEEIDRWRPIVQWLLAIPYLIVARILQYLAFVVVFFAFFVILFTKRFPEGMFKMVLIVQRWNARGYAYADWLVTKYPPFAWE